MIAVAVAALYIHCAKALRRSGLWDAKSWADTSDLPSVACMLRDHYRLPDLDVNAVERRLEESYTKTLWLAGGSGQPLTGDER